MEAKGVIFFKCVHFWGHY